MFNIVILNPYKIPKVIFNIELSYAKFAVKYSTPINVPMLKAINIVNIGMDINNKIVVSAFF